jgi:hypothetical protein
VAQRHELEQAVPLAAWFTAFLIVLLCGFGGGIVWARRIAVQNPPPDKRPGIRRHRQPLSVHARPGHYRHRRLHWGENAGRDRNDAA